MAKKFLKTDLVRSLEKHVGAPVGTEGLETLIYGWRWKQRITSHAIYVRNWLTYEETVSLSKYAGYDLTEI